MAGEIEIVVSLHRPAYRAMPTPQQVYVLLEAKPSAATPGSDKKPVNFSLVLDRSGSMAGEKLRYMKEAAKHLVDRLGDELFAGSGLACYQYGRIDRLYANDVVYKPV